MSVNEAQQDPRVPVMPSHTLMAGPEPASFIRPLPVRGPPVAVLRPPSSMAPVHFPAPPTRNPTAAAQGYPGPPMHNPAAAQTYPAPPSNPATFLRNPTPMAEGQAFPVPAVRNQTPVAAAQAYPTPMAAAQAYRAPASSLPTFQMAPSEDSDDDTFDASSLMSSVCCFLTLF